MLGSLLASGVALCVNQKHKVSPLKFIITGADGLRWPEAQHQHTYPTGCQHISKLFFFHLIFLCSLQPTNCSQHHRAWTLQPSQADPRAAWHGLICPAAWQTDLRLICSLFHSGERGDVTQCLPVCGDIPYLGSHGSLCFQLLLQLLDAGLKRETGWCWNGLQWEKKTVCFH